MDAQLFQRLCALGKLGAQPDEIKTVINQMSQIVGLMDSIKSVEILPFPPEEGVSFENLRPDVSAPSLKVEEALQNAREPQNNCFTVPKIME
ncbi:MAG: hypothetical protein LBC56_08935 [Oscillospiraceae bacterium]|jgi:aspartyl/glutamyl-tRNA(Asn/Gln) amidotransferase C subunit|nr:hypothetical protein [Oscillospiraceae bacterium]